MKKIMPIVVVFAVLILSDSITGILSYHDSIKTDFIDNGEGFSKTKENQYKATAVNYQKFSDYSPMPPVVEINNNRQTTELPGAILWSTIVKLFSFLLTLNTFSKTSISRQSLCFVTRHYVNDVTGIHVDGITFNFLTIHDGDFHYVNLTGYAEIQFCDGGYFNNTDFFVYNEWHGGTNREPTMMLIPVSVYWPDRPVRHIHVSLEYIEDGESLRTIEKTYYGNYD